MIVPIDSATLQLRVTTPDNSPVNIHRITEAWTEGGVNWANTGNNFDSSVVHGSFTPSSDDSFVTANLTSLVQDWVCGVPNHGIMLIATSNDEQSKYASKESDTASHRPSLQIAVGSGSSPCGPPTSCTYDLTPSSGQPGTATVDITTDRFQIEFTNANSNTLYTIWADHRNRTTLQLADDYPLGEGALPRGVAPVFGTTTRVTSGMGLDANAIVTDSQGNATLSVPLDYNLLGKTASPVVGAGLAMQGLNRVGGGWLRVYPRGSERYGKLTGY